MEQETVYLVCVCARALNSFGHNISPSLLTLFDKAARDLQTPFNKALFSWGLIPPNPRLSLSP